MNIHIRKYSIKNKKIFNNLKIRFIPNEINFLLGKNGSGKTTLFKLLSNIYPYYENCNNIAFVPDEIMLPKHLYVKEIFSMFSDNHKENILMEKLELKNIKISKMSKGMLKKTVIILTLIQNKKIYLFDEIELGLDIKSFATLKKILKEEKKTIIISTHNMNKFKNLSNNICSIN